MAVITKESVKPKPRADKAEILTNAKELMDGGQSLSETARILDVPLSTLHSWMAREKKRAANARKVLESVDSGKELQSKATEVVICADCGKEIAGCVFTGKGHGPRCFKCAVKKDYNQDNTTDFNVKYVPIDNDYLDDTPPPYVLGPDPLDVQIDVMLDCLWAEKRAKLKAHLKPLLSDAEAWDMVKCIIARGLA